MRLWSIHPKLLDRTGLLACWREGLLAKAVLEGKTKGYKNHPQLHRFSSVGQVNEYLYHVYKEACKRGYHFDKTKIGKRSKGKIKLTNGQLNYEFEQLKKKLKTRDPETYKKLKNPEPHPMFTVVKGPVASWERV